MPALVTPFSGGEVDWKALEKLVEWQLAEGSHGLVPCGTTGESPTLSLDEHHAVVKRVAEIVAGRVPVIAGAGSNDTAVACMHVAEAEKAGADAVLVIAPYYNKPNQEGMYRHFRAVAEVGKLPVFVYNVPGRTVADVTPETIARLAEVPNIAGIKDASGDVARVVQARVECPENFCILSGSDELTLGMMVSGANGAISVTANVAPRLCADFMDACLEGRWDDARGLAMRLHHLHLAMFASPSPGPAKYAMHRMGNLRDPEIRLPMISCTKAEEAVVDSALERAGLV
ncbi:MAG: 4-hydroxy-tetrahydrodipicolinate synthase [Pacificimonas sp.]